MLLLSLLVAWPAFAVVWSPSGDGATHIPLVDFQVGSNGRVLNSSLVADVIATNPGKEYLDVSATPTVDVNGFVTSSTSRVKAFALNGTLVYWTPAFYTPFALAAQSAFPVAPSTTAVALFNDTAIGVATYGGASYVVHANVASAQRFDTNSGAFLWSGDKELWLQVVNLAKVQVNLKHIYSPGDVATPAFWVFQYAEVSDANGDGNDDLVVKFEHTDLNGRTRVLNQVFDLLSGVLLNQGTYWL